MGVLEGDDDNGHTVWVGAEYVGYGASSLHKERQMRNAGRAQSRRLYPYQRKGVRFLRDRKRAYLADQMGLGKTVQAIIAARSLPKLRSVLVVCPAVAVLNWQRELDMWWPGTRPDIKVISYSTLIRRPQGEPYDLVILDEAHYCKSIGAKRTRRALGEAKRAEYAWLLSGTPMPNDPTELWAPIKYLWPEIPKKWGITTAYQWLSRFTYHRPTPYGPRPYRVRNGAELREAIRPIMLRRHLDEVGLQLPPLRVHVQRMASTPELDRALLDYANMVELTTDLEDSYTSTLRRLLGEAKAPMIAERIVQELLAKEYKKIVVLYHHRDVGAELWEQLVSFGVVGFHGGTSQVNRQNAIDAFQTNPRERVLCAQQTAAGIAINLTAASEVVLVEPAWSPDDNAQAIARIHRIGQDQPCRARIFSVAGTLDEAIMDTLARKIQMQKEVLGGD